MKIRFKKGNIPWNKGLGEISKNKICIRCKNIFNVAAKSQLFCSKSCATSARPGGMSGKRMLPETRIKMSNSHKGEKSYLWKGGITPINEAIRHSINYKLWIQAVFKRDNYTCQQCGDNQGGNLEAHHIKPFAQYPELRFAIDNGQTLCHSCHIKTDNYGGKSRIKNLESIYVKANENF